MKSLLTPEYQAQLVEKHATKPWGGGGASWMPEFLAMVQRRGKYPGCDKPTVLDYGCGRHTFREAANWLMPQFVVFEYDPGLPGFDVLPKNKSDFAICTDVMEHVEEQFVRETLVRIRDLCKYSVLFNIALSPSKSLLPNGQNAHVTVKPATWWEVQLGMVFRELKPLPHHKGFTAVAHI